ncbi:bifunctional 2-polyprenyl-6-hydroxyphenol methylase/3-demethylubiquinol 3-O-methyltransferase UbiG [Argonema galeatum]|uniref:bifunctional 2-polyprenyl-6-hydroxyphenol methylase/3-demethylubiquinol 3-O-methyltransferase UbiG n=1 Tax=Argonema galeatum TaxID=2942762 RepID=UPI0020137509|nr:bifunctional 2-polyprenyl-6-hydroxyphenol methylase/3-demethylubiquinol 3-O-methyltransferase UbiG [Argonema galeatum]MCL1463547.1 bifunctional 2-polyprenyl-6-hydroxyphenol methylase/3-demethylubiquinol 3-O-methyltransferase UbiG [Argonema galeatum A003/A1]
MKKNDLEFYDLNANNWWEEDSKIYALYHLNKPRFEFFDRYVPNWQGLKALDVGCGGGFSCEFMADRGVEVSGIDRSAKCIEKAQEHAVKRGIKIDYKYGLAEEMPYEDNTFDVVVCVDVLEHIADLNKVISEINRILKPNGLFFFDTINRNFKSKFVMIWLMENILREIKQGVHDWRKFIKPEELTDLMEERSFTDIDIKGFDMFGEALKLNWASYKEFKSTGVVKVRINDDTSVMYIGKAVKQCFLSAEC